MKYPDYQTVRRRSVLVLPLPRGEEEVRTNDLGPSEN